MVTARIERMVRSVRWWRAATDGSGPLDVSAELDDADVRRLRRVIDDAIDARGGEVAARRRAQSIGATFSTLSAGGRRRFLQLLANEYGHDDDTLERAIDAVHRAGDGSNRWEAIESLRRALQPRRERLLRRFASLDGGPAFVVGLREDLLGHLPHSPDLAPVDADLKRLLEGWFDVAMLELERITWDSPASLLERLITYEAVHAIESWDDLRGRLAPGRRCYAFMHPAMPGDPLIFVQVALTEGIASNLDEVLDHAAERVPAATADAAIFYSISNCHRGLAGVSLGDFLIKTVAERLTEELPNLKQFATLSPLPGFRRWLAQSLQTGTVSLSASEAADLAGSEVGGVEARAVDSLAGLVRGDLPPQDDVLLEQSRPALLRLAAGYLLDQRLDARALDPVAHFHLSNGASIEQLNWGANLSQTGWERGLGMMVNYRYELRDIERNHERYATSGEIAAADSIRRLVVRGDDP